MAHELPEIKISHPKSMLITGREKVGMLSSENLFMQIINGLPCQFALNNYGLEGIAQIQTPLLWHSQFG